MPDATLIISSLSRALCHDRKLTHWQCLDCFKAKELDKITQAYYVHKENCSEQILEQLNSESLSRQEGASRETEKNYLNLVPVASINTVTKATGGRKGLLGLGVLITIH